MATAKPLFFGLPRELRDEIYELVALDADSLYYEFSLKAGEPVQKTALATSDVSRGCPELTGSGLGSTTSVAEWRIIPDASNTGNFMSGACAKFTNEYSAAVKNRIECLVGMAVHGETRPGLAACEWVGEKWVRLELSRQADGGNNNNQNVHALTIPIPVVSRPLETDEAQAVMYITFRFQDNRELGPREQITISSTLAPGSGRQEFRIPRHVLHQLNILINAAYWGNSKDRFN
jgi:hypothetical protein